VVRVCACVLDWIGLADEVKAWLVAGVGPHHDDAGSSAGVELIVDAMAAHVSSPSVQEFASAVIWNLSLVGGCRVCGVGCCCSMSLMCVCVWSFVALVFGGVVVCCISLDDNGWCAVCVEQMSFVTPCVPIRMSADNYASRAQLIPLSPPSKRTQTGRCRSFRLVAPPLPEGSGSVRFVALLWVTNSMESGLGGSTNEVRGRLAVGVER